MTDKYIVPAVNRAIEVLDYLATSKKALSLHELSIISSIPKSTLFRILITLEKHHFIEQDLERKKFHLGFKLWELGNIKIDTTELVVVAINHLKELSEAIMENIFLGVLDENEVIYIQRIECSTKVKAFTKIGRRAPAYCTATGQVLLSNYSDSELMKYFENIQFTKYNNYTPDSEEKIIRKLRQVNENGYALANGEFNCDLLCLSVPVRDYSKKIMSAITIDMLSSKKNLQKARSYIPLLKETASLISKELGYKS